MENLNSLVIWRFCSELRNITSRRESSTYPHKVVEVNRFIAVSVDLVYTCVRKIMHNHLRATYLNTPPQYINKSFPLKVLWEFASQVRPVSRKSF